MVDKFEGLELAKVGDASHLVFEQIALDRDILDELEAVEIVLNEEAVEFVGYLLLNGLLLAVVAQRDGAYQLCEDGCSNERSHVVFEGHQELEQFDLGYPPGLEFPEDADTQVLLE